MKNADVIDRLTNYLGVKTVAEVERELGLSNGTLHKFKKGIIGVPRTLLSALYKKDLNPNYFLVGEGAPQINSGETSVSDKIINLENANFLDFIERLLDYFDKPICAIEQELGVSNGYIGKYKAGKITDPSKLIQGLRRHGLNPAYFLTGDGEPELEGKRGTSTIEEFKKLLIPFLSQKASAGNGVELMPGDEVIRYISIPDNIAQIKGLYALKVAGDSMYPTLADGDIVICDSNGWSGDGIYVIRTADSEFVKRVVLTPQGYQVISDNNLYPPYACRTEDAEMIGRVRCAVVKV